MADREFVTSFVDRWSSAWDSRDPDRIVELCTDDVSWSDPALPETIHGRDAVRDFLVSMLRGFPDAKFTPVGEAYLQPGDDAAALHWRVEATMLGEVEPPGLAPTGERLVGEGIDLYRFRDGLVAQYATIYDLSVWMRAMGLLPPQGGRMERVGVFFQRLGARRARRKNAAVTSP